MGDRRENTVRQRSQIGGTSFHVGDCHVWAEISYLDSDTDYRESLPNNVCCWSRQDELTMLDKESGFGWRRTLLFVIFVVALVIVTVLLNH